MYLFISISTIILSTMSFCQVYECFCPMSLPLRSDPLSSLSRQHPCIVHTAENNSPVESALPSTISRKL